ncbi:type IX secretion component PorD family protein, partial [Prevotella nigrescens]
MKRSANVWWLTTLLTSWFLFFSSTTVAQELQAKITINHNQIQGTDKSVFENLQQTLEQ